MGILQKIAPQWALKREIARRRLERLDRVTGKRSLEAVAGGRSRADFLKEFRSPDASFESDIKSARGHIRQLEENNGFVSGPIQRIASNVVGNGFSLQSTVKPDKQYSRQPAIRPEMAMRWNTGIETVFKRWCRYADVRMINSFTDILHLIEMALVRDNGVVVVGRNSRKKNRIIPYCLELFEIDRLETPMEEIQNPRFRNGIEYDSEGAPIRYYLLKVHPGETKYSFARRQNDYEEIPAYNPNGTQKVFHLFNPIRPEQSIGLTFFAAGLKDFQDLDRYLEAEKLAALEDACLTGFVKSNNPQGFNANYTDPSGSADYDRIHEFAPNKWHYLNPGEEVDIHAPSRPNNQFEQMINQLLRGPANALNMPPEILTQDWAGMNYSNARTILLQFYRACRSRQKYLTDHFCIGVHENIAFDVVALGTYGLTAPGFDIRRDDWLDHTWIPPGWQWIDPTKEAKGKEIELDNNMETLSDLYAAQGYDFEEKIERRAYELKRIKDLEEQYGIKFPSKDKGQQDPASEEEVEPAKPQLKVVK